VTFFVVSRLCRNCRKSRTNDCSTARQLSRKRAVKFGRTQLTDISVLERQCGREALIHADCSTSIRITGIFVAGSHMRSSGLLTSSDRCWTPNFDRDVTNRIYVTNR
jgi:hypothetical protein